MLRNEKGLTKVKTLIELFDESQIENVIAALSLKPEKIIFVGFKEVMTKERTKAIESFFMENCKGSIVDFEVVGRFDLEAVKERIASIVLKNPDAVIDITGGKELVIAALGEVLAENNVPVVQFDIKSGKIIPVKNAEGIEIIENPKIKIKDLISLNCGKVVKDDGDWTLDSDFCEDIESVFALSKENCGLWNRQATALGNFEKYGNLDAFFRVSINLYEIRKRKKDAFIDEALLEKLKDKNLIYGYEKNGDYLSFFYKNDSVRRLITKSGNVLELYGYMLINEIMKENPSFADDCDVGVFLDWDGVDTSGAETRNEIDLMVIKDFVPVFISCKNGEVYKEALYELDTLAHKFGGAYAKKVMFASYVSTDSAKKEYIKKRASDMGIILIDGIEKMEREEFKNKIKQLI